MSNNVILVVIAFLIETSNECRTSMRIEIDHIFDHDLK